MIQSSIDNAPMRANSPSPPNNDPLISNFHCGRITRRLLVPATFPFIFHPVLLIFRPAFCRWTVQRESKLIRSNTIPSTSKIGQTRYPEQTNSIETRRTGGKMERENINCNEHLSCLTDHNALNDTLRRSLCSRSILPALFVFRKTT